MVDDQQLGAEHLLAGLEIETFGVVGAGPTEAIAAVALHGVPNGRQRLKAEIAAAAFLGLPRPSADLLQLIGRARLGHEGAGALLRPCEAAQADIVGAAFDEQRREGLRHDFLEKRDVFLN